VIKKLFLLSILCNAPINGLQERENMSIAQSSEIHEMISVWDTFFKTTTWQDIARPCAPIVNGCGIIYALPVNFLDRSNEDCAIVDMRNVKFTEPHYHHNIEIYFIMQGSGIVVLGNKEHAVSAGDIIFITPNTAHFTIPNNDLVMAVVNTPPYTPEDYFPLTASNEEVCFDWKQFEKLTHNSSEPAR
jgi:mannose-6-phosphate isomerase-like protein (cupin superfamily)